MEENLITGKIIQCAIKVRKRFGPGLLENAYRDCLYYDLKQNGLFVRKEVILPLEYEEVIINYGYRMDLLVEEKVVVELKAVEALNDIHLAQVLTYLKLGNFKLGLLINFNVLRLKDGIKRIIN
jgi:GxxExxY protein